MVRTLLFVVFLFSASSSLSATLHVAKDGSSEFTVIQDAIDAASPGDTIWVHAGRYDELTEDCELWDDGTVADCHVVFTKDNLTLRGDGKDVTIIGPAVHPEDHPLYYFGIGTPRADRTSAIVRDLTIENCDWGIYAATPNCEFTGLSIQGCDEAIRDAALSGCLVEDCDIVNCGNGIKAFTPARNLTVRDSRFSVDVYGCLMVLCENVLVQNTTFSGGSTAFSIQQDSDAVIRNVVVSNCEVVSVDLSIGGSVEIYDSQFEGGYYGVASSGAFVRCERSTFSNQSYRTLYLNGYGTSYFHECEIINGGGVSAYCDYNGTDDCHIDMTNNYWGTDSEEQIREWIEDTTDDPEICCTVDFIPFVTGTPVETKSLSSLKNMFK